MLVTEADRIAQILELLATDRLRLLGRVQVGDALPDLATLVLALVDLPGEGDVVAVAAFRLLRPRSRRSCATYSPIGRSSQELPSWFQDRKFQEVVLTLFSSPFRLVAAETAGSGGKYDGERRRN